MRCVSEPICSRMGPRAGMSASGMCSAAFLWKLLAFALGQAMTEGLDRSSNVVHELGAAIYQRLPGTDDSHMSLRVFAPVLEWVQELRVHSCQASEVLGVDLICLTLVGVDEPQFTSIGHQDHVAALL